MSNGVRCVWIFWTFFLKLIKVYEDLSHKLAIFMLIGNVRILSGSDHDSPQKCRKSDQLVGIFLDVFQKFLRIHEDLRDNTRCPEVYWISKKDEQIGS